MTRIGMDCIAEVEAVCYLSPTLKGTDMRFFTTRFSSPSDKLADAYWLNYLGHKEDALHVLHELCRDIDRPPKAQKKERWNGIEKVEAYEAPEAAEVAAGSSDDEYAAWWERANDWR